jgi:ferredoxin
MAEYEDRWPENVPGEFFVDGQCIDCDLCRQIAPQFFKREAQGGYTYVAMQPTGADEIDLCTEALESCPVDAIGQKKSNG